MTAQDKKILKSKNFSFQVAVLLIAVILAGLLIGIFSPKFEPFFAKFFVGLAPKPTITPTPTIIPTVIPGNLRLLPTGVQVFEVQSGEKSGPSFRNLIINPLDIVKGEEQTVSIEVEFNSPVSKVTLTTVTDNKTTPHELKLVEGTAQSGKWEGTWTIDDGNFFKYRMDIEAEASSGAKSTLNPIFR